MSPASPEVVEHVRTIALALISHTNAGKTTLARTLLGEDVGEVRDAAHVTLASTPYTMLATDEGDALVLVDTPGFGDSARLARRLAQHGNPIGWFLEQVWDRWRDRPLWLAQQAVRAVRDQADVVLYLVNAAEAPEDVGYVPPELDVLAWIGKPTLVLLNQTGQRASPEDDLREIERWRPLVATRAFVHGVLPLDAFARSWVQERVLLDAVLAVLDPVARPAMRRLTAAWLARSMQRFDAAMAALARPLALAAADRERASPTTLKDLGRELWNEVARRTDQEPMHAPAMRALATRLDALVRASIDQVIALYDLRGSAAGEMLARLAQTVTASAPVSEGKAALLGGFVSGALTGVAADLVSGGLTLGAGLLAGGVLGALGAAGLARGVNVVRGRTETLVRWSDEFLDALVVATLLRYLAVAHFGRGRGAWQESEQPAFWRECVGRAVDARRDAWHALWSAGRNEGSSDALVQRVETLLAATARAVLAELYPRALG